MTWGNHVTITGNVVRDPELRFTAGGAAVASFGIAFNKKKGDAEEAHFFDIVAWNQLAENCAETLTKGMRVTVDGELQQRTWEVKGTNERRSKVEIVADSVAPDLRWATAVVTRTSSGAPSNGGGNGGQRRPAGAPAGGPAYDPEEEPFITDAEFLFTGFAS